MFTVQNPSVSKKSLAYQSQQVKPVEGTKGKTKHLEDFFFKYIIALFPMFTELFNI